MMKKKEFNFLLEAKIRIHRHHHYVIEQPAWLPECQVRTLPTLLTMVS